jgi:hypothetical protein
MAYPNDDWALPPRRHRRDTFLGDDDWDRRARPPYRCEIAHRRRERYSMNISQPRRRTSAPTVLRSPNAPVEQDLDWSDHRCPTINIYNDVSLDDNSSFRYLEHGFPRGGPLPPIHPAAGYQALEDLRHTPPIPIPGAWPSPYPPPPLLRNTTALNKAIEVARTELFVTLTRRGDSSAPKVAILNLATAQRLVLSSIQHKILSSAHGVMTQDPGFVVPVDTMGYDIKKYCEPESQVLPRHLEANTAQAKPYETSSTCKNIPHDMPKTTAAIPSTSNR